MTGLPASQTPPLVLAVLCLTTLVLYLDTTQSLVRLWTSSQNPTYSHGLLLVAVCGFLGFRRWPEVASVLPSRPSGFGLLLILGLSFLWFLAGLAGVLIVQQVSLLLIVAAIVLSITGLQGARLLAVPIGLMIFAIPVWEPLNPHLQELTANVVTFLVNMSGVPAALEGTAIWVPAGTFEVAPSCSGLAQLIVGMMVAVLYAYTTRQRLKPSLWLLAAAIAVSILSNTVRIYTVVMAGQLTDMQHYFVTTDHWTPGWVIFGIFMAAYVLIANRLVPPADTPSAAAKAAPQSTKPRAGTGGVAAGAALGLCALLAGPLLAYAYRYEPSAEVVYALDLPDRIGDRQGLPPPVGYYRPSFTGPDLEVQRLYRAAGDKEAYLYVAYYAAQRQGKEAVYYLNRVYDGRDWKPASTRSRVLPIAPSAVEESRIRSQTGAQKIVWRWYYAGGMRTSNDYEAKLLGLWETLKGNPAMAVIVVAVDVEKGDGSKAAAFLSRFVTDALAPLERAIDGAGT